MTVTRTHTYPEGTPPGVYTITATDGINTAQAQITILDPTPNTVTVNPDSIAAGGTVTVAGEGYPTETAGTVTVVPAAGGEPIVTVDVTTDVNGAIPDTAVLIPAGTPAGQYTVNAEVDGETGQATLTVTAQQQLAFPADLAVSAATADSITLTWTANADATGYVVQYREQGTTDWTPNPQVAAGTTTDTVTGLTPGGVYEFQAQSVGDGTSHTSSEFGPATPVTGTASEALPVPADLAVTTAGVTQTDVPLTWTAVANASAYHVQYKPTADTAWGDWTPDPTEAGVTVTGLTANTSYDFRVRAVGDGAGFTDSADSDPVTQVTAA